MAHKLTKQGIRDLNGRKMDGRYNGKYIELPFIPTKDEDLKICNGKYDEDLNKR